MNSVSCAPSLPRRPADPYRDHADSREHQAAADDPLLTHVMPDARLMLCVFALTSDALPGMSRPPWNTACRLARRDFSDRRSIRTRAPVALPAAPLPPPLAAVPLILPASCANTPDTHPQASLRNVTGSGDAEGDGGGGRAGGGDEGGIGAALLPPPRLASVAKDGTSAAQHVLSARIVMVVVWTCECSQESADERTLAGIKGGIDLPPVPLPLHALQNSGLVRAGRELEPLSVALPTFVRIEVEGPAETQS